MKISLLIVRRGGGHENISNVSGGYEKFLANFISYTTIFSTDNEDLKSEFLSIWGISRHHSTGPFGLFWATAKIIFPDLKISEKVPCIIFYQFCSFGRIPWREILNGLDFFFEKPPYTFLALIVRNFRAKNQKNP